MPSYTNPRWPDKAKQIVILNSPIRACYHTVRDIQTHDGREYGWVRHDGGDWVVRREHGGHGEIDRWEIVSVYSATALRAGVLASYSEWVAKQRTT